MSKPNPNFIEEEKQDPGKLSPLNAHYSHSSGRQHSH